MIVLASCQDVAEETGQIEAVSFEPGYPSLHTVPPRPQLSYTVEQRRAIVDGLIADRANARYSSDVVRYRAGLSGLPPPEAPAMAAVPLAPEPEVPDAADAVAPTAPARDAPVVDPETEFLYEDDDLGTFMEEMVDERIGPPGPAGPGGEPEANAAPLETKVIRASAERPIPRAAAFSWRAPVVTLAMPPQTASLPVPVAANGTEQAASSAPAAVGMALAGRAPGVVWGMPDLTPPPDEPLVAMADTSAERPRPAPPPASAAIEPPLAGRAAGVVWGMPDLTPPPEAAPSVVAEAPADRPRPAPSPVAAAVEPSLAARAPGVVWGMPDLAPAPAGPPAAAPTIQVAHAVTAAPHAAPMPAPLKPAGAPAAMVLAGEAAPGAPPAQAPRQAAPPAPAPVKPARPVPAETALAGRVPDSVWAIPAAMADAPAGQIVAAIGRAPALTVAHAPLPAPAKPPVDDNAPEIEPVTMAAAAQPQAVAKPVADAAGIELAGGLVGVDPASGRRHAGVLGSVPFDPQSAMLTPAAVARLAQFLADARARDAQIEIVGEAPAPALALDRALAVGLALVQSGVSANRLELTLARGGSGDQARLFLAAPEL